MKHYLEITKKILENGTRKENRTGIDTISLFNVNYEVDLRNGFPLLTTKFVSWKSVVIELLWFLSGSTNVAFLHKHGVKFWDSWSDEKGEVTAYYGKHWRKLPGYIDSEDGVKPIEADQVRWVLNELMTNPYSRRMVVSAWAPQCHEASLPPCHVMWTLNVQNDIDGAKNLNLHLQMRSNDWFLGNPFNLASYSLLLHLYSRFSGIPVGKFAHSIVDAHIYVGKQDGSDAEYDHSKPLLEQMNRQPLSLPTLEIADDVRTLDDVEKLLDKSTDEIMSKFVIKNYVHHPALKSKAAV